MEYSCCRACNLGMPWSCRMVKRDTMDSMEHARTSVNNRMLTLSPPRGLPSCSQLKGRLQPCRHIDLGGSGRLVRLIGAMRLQLNALYITACIHRNCSGCFLDIKQEYLTHPVRPPRQSRSSSTLSLSPPFGLIDFCQLFYSLPHCHNGKLRTPMASYFNH